MHAPPRIKRPLAVTLIAIFQFGLAAYVLFFIALACMKPEANLILLFRALGSLGLNMRTRPPWPGSHADIKFELFFCVARAVPVAVYGLATAWGLWRLKKWARHTVVAVYAVELAFFLRFFIFFGFSGGFSHVPYRVLQPVYLVVYFEVLIVLMLLYYGNVAEAFGEAD
jgi:hypothetical protein